MISWRIYYGDDETFDSGRGPWLVAPAWNVQVLATPDEFVGRELDHGKGFYLWWPAASKPWGVDAVGLYDYLWHIRHPEAGKPLSMVNFNSLIEVGVKFGRSIDNARFRQIMEQANQDPVFPKKSGMSIHERRDG